MCNVCQSERCVKCGEEFKENGYASNGICVQCSRQVEHCLYCGEPFDSMHLNDEGVCSRCANEQTLGSCFGCGSQFLIKSSDSAFCATCEKKRKKGICLNCGRLPNDYNWVDQNGKCDVCKWPNKKETFKAPKRIYVCSQCNKREVYSPYDVCDHCKDKIMRPGYDD